jgi:hypothetical protein
VLIEFFSKGYRGIALIVLLVGLVLMFFANPGPGRGLPLPLYLSAIRYAEIEDMSVSAHAQLDDPAEITALVEILDTENWHDLGYHPNDYADYHVSDYFITVEGQYLLALGKWDDTYDIARVKDLQNPDSFLEPCGWYKIPKTVLPDLDDYTRHLFKSREPACCFPYWGGAIICIELNAAASVSSK